MEYKVPTKVGMDISFRKIPSRQSRHALKIIVAMKLIAFLFLFNLQVTASVYSQRISLTATNTPLREVLQTVRKQSGYSFFVESDNLRDSKPVNLYLMENSVPEALDKIFENQPFTYTIENNVIVVTRKPRTDLSAADFLTFDNGGPDSTKVVYIQGSVRDDKGQPLVGVSIRIKGGGTGTVTKPDGTYSLKTNAAAVLVFSYIGYLSREIKASQGSVDVVLKQLNTALDQVQVIAYGTTTKRYTTGNVATVTAETIANQPVSNPLLALSGSVPGLFIRQASGVSAGRVSVNIQGINSLAQGTDPFFVVDGVPYSPNNLPPAVSASAFLGTGSALNYINPSDIESITVLKDADATAIYGSRAANGAILITTKKGKSGKTKVDLNLQTGFEKVPKFLPVLNTKDYIALRKTAKKNDNASITPTDYDINGTWDTTQTTNWQKELVGKTARFTNLQGSISGGSNNTQFLVSGGYLKETTVFPGDFADIKVNVHTNINHTSNNQKFRFYISTTYVEDNNNLAYGDLMTQALITPPNAPSLYNRDGSLNWGYVPSLRTYSFDNPLGILQRQYTIKTNNLVGSSEISYTIIPGLDLKTALNYNKVQGTEIGLVPQSSFNPGIVADVRSNITANKSITSWSIEPQITYKRNFNHIAFDGLIGASLQQTKNSVLAIIGQVFASDLLVPNIQSASNLSVYSTLQSTYRYDAAFSRLNLRYLDKYILTLSGRRDGSSRFGSENRFSNFYSASGAWLFGDEKFVTNNFKPLSFGKLKISYGTTGNDQIGDYKYLTLYNNISTGIPYQQTVGLQPTGHANPYLQWELTRKLNIGIDLGLYNNRILFSGNYYINNSNNQLIGYPLGYTTGFTTINQNINANIKNTGLELQIDANIIKNRSLSWNSSLNFTTNKNVLTRFDGLEKSTLARTYVIGEPVNIRKVIPFIDVNPQTGLYEYRTADGKATSTPSLVNDRTSIINTNPKWFGGLSNKFDYKNFTLDFLFQFVKQVGPSGLYTMFGRSPGLMLNVPSVILDQYWQKSGDQKTYQKPSTLNNASYNALSQSDVVYQDASFIRLRNISLSYNLPQSWIKKTKISYAKIYALGQNIFTITNYYGIDPETQTLLNLPTLRTITFGIQFGL
ncbi:SusC/RagA family TonB-linked outer membrane protein [Chitinophaga varians]|uniref:SusC/RagA family TonB-linked outer membrane protein n=1 Tax=Chitinophaga varians TaxID=2202339 RepID=UPI00165FFEB5|nr:SusC/RagA family TonB-linked outer membrane protein [Chitinophaga varians]MBC9915094.1 SusC/RagA family TonB-linked outer membrane protein [Chitinophaga varians]